MKRHKKKYKKKSHKKELVLYNIHCIWIKYVKRRKWQKDKKWWSTYARQYTYVVQCILSFKCWFTFIKGHKTTTCIVDMFKMIFFVDINFCLKDQLEWLISGDHMHFKKVNHSANFLIFPSPKVRFWKFQWFVCVHLFA